MARLFLIVVVLFNGLAFTSADATPVTFADPVRFNSNDTRWFDPPDGVTITSGSYGTNAPLILGFAALLGPFSEPVTTSTPFHTDAALDGQTFFVENYPLPPSTAQYFGPGLAIELPMPRDYDRHTLLIQLSTPDDARTVEFGYQQPVPEPSTLLLAASAVLGLACWYPWKKGQR